MLFIEQTMTFLVLLTFTNINSFHYLSRVYIIYTDQLSTFFKFLLVQNSRQIKFAIDQMYLSLNFFIQYLVS